MSRRPTLLFVTPVAPASTGNGLAMRASAVLAALTRHYAVTLAIVPLYGGRDDALPPEVRSASVRVVRLGASSPLDRNERFDVVHLFRLAVVAAATPWLERAGACHLDLDELESDSRRGIAAIHAANGEPDFARRELAAAARARRAEDEVLARFDRVYVAAADDRARLLARGNHRAEVMVLPNTLPLPAFSLPPPPDHGPLTLLFVGTLGYAPNADAVRFFVTEILPLLRSGGEEARLLVAGAGAAQGVRHLAALPGVNWLGEVPEVAPCYRDAQVAVVPLRAGGGTRIKMLEAFALRRPVVTTTLGIAGIAAESGRHALIADTPDAFAAACRQLGGDRHLAARLTAEAFDLFQREYTHEALDAIVSPRDVLSAN